MAKAWKVRGIKPKKSYRRNARVILPIKVEEVYSWAPYIHDPQNVKALHDMRISIKRLRYSMEFFAINYGKTFTASLLVMEELQELIGEIHDYDVIGDVLTDYRQNLEPNDAETDEIGINALISRYHQTRQEKYQAFLQRWDELEQTDFKGQLLNIIRGKSKAKRKAAS
jgi:CHAD domain-containing protein